MEAGEGSRSPMAGGVSPRDEYQKRLADRRREVLRQSRREQVFGNLRVVIFLAGLTLAWFVFARGNPGPWWLAIPVAAFVAVAVAYDRVYRQGVRARRAVAFYERGVDRLNHRWQGKGEPGTRFLDETHPNAADLDLFGPGSVFELLCQVRTEGGEEMLAAWLLHPADAGEVRARQAAVAELRPYLDLREDLDVLGTSVRAIVRPAGLASWGAAPPVLRGALARWAALALGAAGAVTLAGWAFLDAGRLPFLVVASLELTFSTWLRPKVRRALAGLDRRAGDLAVLATLLARLEGEQWSAPRLRRLHEVLDTQGLPPSARIAHLSRLVDRLNWAKNMLFAPFAAVLLWDTQHAFALEAWRAASGPAIARWLAAVAEFEALSALAAYSFENPADPFPEIVPSGPLVEGEGLGHPLIPDDRCVRNDLALGSPTRLLLVSGSNMSGKSTLLRTVGVNAVLALAGAPVRARRLRISPLVVGATLRIQDSLQAGRSRFYAEITRLRRLMELAGGSPPLLFLLDEILQGTNSHDRRLGAAAVVQGLIERGAAGLVTTHDLALTEIAAGLGPLAANVHFEDHLENGTMAFDHRMRPGIVQKSNALALMRAVGLDVPPTDGPANR